MTTTRNHVRRVSGTTVQKTHVFNMMLGETSVEVTATWSMLYGVTINDVRRNSDYATVRLTPADRKAVSETFLSRFPV